MISKVSVIKIGGNVLDSPPELSRFLDQFARVPGPKILVHGGGKLATDFAAKLQVPQTMIEGRRVTDAETLKIAIMVYGGMINKTLVAELGRRDVRALGLSGADGQVILSKKRGPKKLTDGREVDYGFVGDIVQVHAQLLADFLAMGLTPVLAPLTADAQGQVLNTNADTIANEVATSLSQISGGSLHKLDVSLVYCFEKRGVLQNMDDELSVIPKITEESFQRLKSEQKIFAGMIPKLENALESVHRGVSRVILGHAQDLTALMAGQGGTTVSK
jgi:acetylglutamate kinase